MAILVVIQWITALTVFHLVEDPSALKVSKFKQISIFLNVFVGLLLSFFMSSSINRWYACAGGFLELFDAIRNLQMQFFALGVREELITICMRYGCLSAHLLNMQLKSECMEEEQAKEYMKKQWDGMTWDGEIGPSFNIAFATPAERATLERVDDPACTLWIWVASRIGRMAQDQDIPGMATPTYGRIVGLVQNAHGGIRSVRASCQVQTPFIYVHLLASLVHINNILNAISFGLTMGISVAVWLAGRKTKGFSDKEMFKPASPKEVAQDLQNLVVVFFFSVFGPLLYQALLEVAICIAQPFAAQSRGSIPTRRLLNTLEKDLRDGQIMATKPPGWEEPRFKPL